MKEYLEKVITKTEKEHTQSLSRFTGDIVHQFHWCAEDVFKQAYKIHFIKVYLMPVIEHYKGVDNEEVLKQVRQYMIETVLSSDKLMGRSSNQMHSYVELWQKEVVTSLIKLFKEEAVDIKYSN